MDKEERNIWWGPPRNYNDKLSERKISWLELFYDLVYVAVIAQLTEHLAQGISIDNLISFLVLFTLILWSWMNGAYYHDTHGNTGIRTRLLTLWQMLAVASLAITINDLFQGHHRGFAISFTLLTMMITYLWFSQSYYDKSHRALSRFYVITYCIGIILFGISISTPFSVSYVLWIIAMLLMINVGFIAAPSSLKELKRRGLVTNVSASMVERFGLFTIIVLGEMIIGIVYGISKIPDKSMPTWFAFIFGILIAFLLWWVYFDMLGECKPKEGFIYMQLLNFLHLALLASFALIGSNMRVILLDASNPPGRLESWIFGGAIAVVLFCIAALSWIMEEEDTPSMRWLMKKLSYMITGTGISILVVTGMSSYFSTVLFMGIIAFILFVPVMIGTRYWVKYKMFEEKNESKPDSI